MSEKQEIHEIFKTLLLVGVHFIHPLYTNWLGKDQWENNTNAPVPTVLNIKNIRKVYETESTVTEAVKNVSFEITKGSFVGIMGASGSGKTTLLNMIATIDKATSGQIEIDGYDIAGLSENDLASFRREHLGFVFQEYNLLDTLTVYENIALALTIKRIPKETVKQTILDLASKLGISEILNKFPYEISGGQRQRCACVRAIAANPSLILADEPTGALDSCSTTQLLETFVMLCRKYTTAGNRKPLHIPNYTEKHSANIFIFLLRGNFVNIYYEA